MIEIFRFIHIRFLIWIDLDINMTISIYWKLVESLYLLFYRLRIFCLSFYHSKFSAIRRYFQFNNIFRSWWLLKNRFQIFYFNRLYLIFSAIRLFVVDLSHFSIDNFVRNVLFFRMNNISFHLFCYFFLSFDVR